jgi:hypothetical protein
MKLFDFKILIMKFTGLTDNFYQVRINERNIKEKCGVGIYLYQNPIIAENASRVIEIPWIWYIYKNNLNI